MRKRSERGRVRGYQPTLTQFYELLELSQRGIDASDAKAKLNYRRGSEVTTSDGSVTKITDDHLSKLIEEAGRPKKLDNLRFTAGQENPIRRVEVHIRPDGWTYYTVEASDFTWILGRFHELTELLLDNRRLTAKAKFPLPEIWTSKQRYERWGTAMWFSANDWRVTFIKTFKEAPALLLPIIFLVFAASPPSFSLARAISFGSFILAYLAGLVGYNRWLWSTFRSCVPTPRSQLKFSMLFTDKDAAPVDRGILLVGAVGVVVSVLTLIVDTLR